MNTDISFSVGKVSGVAYAVEATGENRGAPASALNFTVPAPAAATDDRASARHLRLVRD